MKLTEAKVRAAKPNNKDQMLNDGNGLYLRIRPGGSKKWIIRKKFNGRVTVSTLGQYPSVGLKQARLAAAELAMSKDVNSIKVSDLVTKYMNEVVNPTHRRADFVQGYMNRAVLPALGHRKVRDVNRSEVVAVIQQYSKRGARSADQLRSNLKKLFSYSVELGYRDDNPANEISRRVTGYIPASRKRILTDDEIRKVWAIEHVHGRTLRFLLLTGLRIGEARKGCREEGRWVVSEKLSKNGKAHWVHLTDTAIEQLPLPVRSNEATQSWLRSWCTRQEIEENFTPHDLRRTAATRMADIGIEPFIIERVLNHTLEGVMAVYNRAEYESERIGAIDLLEKHILEVVNS